MELEYTVFGKPSCVFCTKAVKLIVSAGATCEYIDVTTDKEQRAKLIELGFRTVPVIFKGDELIGTYENLKEYLSE